MTAIALTIAGSDSGGGAGIQADLKTFSALGVYGASVLTAVTAQNTMGVFAVEDVSPSMITAQMRAVLTDFRVDAIKIGMLSRAETIEVVADGLQAYRRPVILDPVMVATSGDQLLQSDALQALQSRLLARADLITPNLYEAAILTGGVMAQTLDEVVSQARQLQSGGAKAVLIKGGHGQGEESVDILLSGGKVCELRSPRLATSNDHGTGCTLSAAIAAGLASGNNLMEAVGAAKQYVYRALESGSSMIIGQGRGPVDHFHSWR